MAKGLDIFLLTILILGGYSGFKKGFVLEFFSIASLFIATIVSVRLLDRFVSLYIQWYGEAGTWLTYILFIVLFVLLVLLVSFIGRLFRNLIHLTILGTLDRVMGGVLGILKWSLLMSGLLWFAQLLHLHLATKYTEHSVLFPIIQALAPKFMRFFPWVIQLNHLVCDIPQYPCL